MIRFITTLVQLGIGIPALYMARYVWRDMREMWDESQ